MNQTVQRPTRTLRGTWDEILAHKDEIPMGSEVELKVFEPSGTDVQSAPMADPRASASIALLQKWISQAPTDPEEIRKAEEELREFKRNMNAPRKETGARLIYPEVE
jgi:hypothetical protein